MKGEREVGRRELLSGEVGCLEIGTLTLPHPPVQPTVRPPCQHLSLSFSSASLGKYKSDQGPTTACNPTHEVALNGLFAGNAVHQPLATRTARAPPSQLRALARRTKRMSQVCHALRATLKALKKVPRSAKKTRRTGGIRATCLCLVRKEALPILNLIATPRRPVPTTPHHLLRRMPAGDSP